jgi:hypothetical protein
VTAAGVGPKPSGPTHPTPTAPPKSGHLPPVGPCDCGHGDLPQNFHLTPCPKARPLRLPTLGMVVRDLERAATQMIATATRQYDPTSAPGEDCDPVGPAYVDRLLGCVVSDLRTILRDLDKIAQMSLPPAGSAVQYPARLVPSMPSSASLPGGPTDHLAAPSVASSGGLTPGLAPTQGGSRTTPPGRNAGFTLPVTERFVMPGTDEIAAGINEALARRSR